MITKGEWETDNNNQLIKKANEPKRTLGMKVH